MWVSIKPSAKYSTAVAAVTAAVRNYPGLRHEVLTYRDDRLRNSLGRTGSEITVRVFGQDLKVLRTKANEVKALLGGLSGVRDPHVTTQAAEPTIEIEVDLQKANKFGIKPGDVRRAGATLLSGLRVGSLFEDQKIFDVVVWSTPDSRQSLSTVRDLIIDTPGGQHIRMGDVADVRVRPTAPVIEHQDISRFLDVTANVHGRSVAGVAGKVRAGLASIRFPLEYHATLLKDYDDQQNAQRRVLGFVLAAAAAVFLILQAAFSSWRAAALAFLMIPAAAAGGVIAAWLYGGPMTVATIAGLLAIVAITLRQTIALINSFGRLRMPVFFLDGSLTRDGTPLGAELVRRGVQERFSSVVLSLVTTGAAILPAALFGNIEGQEIVQPMVVVILGGLVTVALVELFVLPSLFCHFGPPEPAVPLELEVEHEPRRSFELVGVQRSATPMSQQVTTTGELS